jgi:hypothetical protein
MNRSKYIPRTGDAGSPGALAAAQALGITADAELIPELGSCIWTTHLPGVRSYQDRRPDGTSANAVA